MNDFDDSRRPAAVDYASPQFENCVVIVTYLYEQMLADGWEHPIALSEFVPFAKMYEGDDLFDALSRWFLEAFIAVRKAWSHIEMDDSYETYWYWIETAVAEREHDLGAGKAP